MLFDFLEEVLERAVEAIQLRIARDVPTVEVLERADDVLRERVVAADFPALLARLDGIKRRLYSDSLTETAVCSEETEAMHVLLLGTLVRKLDIPSAVNIRSVLRRIPPIAAAQSSRLCNVVRRTDTPDMVVLAAYRCTVVLGSSREVLRRPPRDVHALHIRKLAASGLRRP